MTIDQIIALTISFLLLGLSVFQLLLIAGKPWGRFAWGGQHEVLPLRLRIGSGISIIIYALVGYVVLAQASLFASPLDTATLSRITWGLVFYFTLGIILNVISKSKREKLVMTPVVSFLALSCLILAL